jgi:hypothetical protein
MMTCRITTCRGSICFDPELHPRSAKFFVVCPELSLAAGEFRGSLLPDDAQIESDMQRVHSIVSRLPVGKNPIEHGRFVCVWNRLAGVHRKNVRRRWCHEKGRGDEGQPFQTARHGGSQSADSDRQRAALSVQPIAANRRTPQNRRTAAGLALQQ